MVIDSSAIMAVMLGEPDANRIADRIAAGRQSLISAANYVEAGQIGRASCRERVLVAV